MGFDAQMAGYYSPLSAAVVAPKQFVKYVPVGLVTSHNLVLGYALWLIGFTGSHRFYFGKPLSGMLWFFTFGLLGIGWLVDLFLIPSMNRQAQFRYRPGLLSYSLAWVLFVPLGILGFHRFYQGKIITGLLFLVTGGLLGMGYVYDLFTLNEQIDAGNLKRARTVAAYGW